MPLLESGYKAAAKTELEQDIRELEARTRRHRPNGVCGIRKRRSEQYHIRTAA